MFVIEFVIVFVGLMLTRGCKSVSYKRRGRGQSSCVPTSSAFLNVVHCTLLLSSFLKLRQCVRLRLPSHITPSQSVLAKVDGVIWESKKTLCFCQVNIFPSSCCCKRQLESPIHVAHLQSAGSDSNISPDQLLLYCIGQFISDTRK